MGQRLKDKEGYPLTPEQFSESEERCVKLFIKNEDIPAFEKAAYRAYVRFIRVDQHLKEDNPPGQTKFFTRHILEERLFDFGRYFQEEKEKTKYEQTVKALEDIKQSIFDERIFNPDRHYIIKKVLEIFKKK